MNNNRPQWEPEDAALFRSFLSTPTGTLFLAHLRWHKPASKVDPDPTAVALTLGRVQGYDAMLEAVDDLRAPRPRPDRKITTD